MFVRHDKEMKKKLWIWLTAILLLSTAAAFYFYWTRTRQSSFDRSDVLATVPADASAVIFVDLNELRSGSFFAKLYAWAPKPQADPDYEQFLKDTGFDYERDLSRIAIAFEKRGHDSAFFAVADGKFDRSKITGVAMKNGTLSKTGAREIFSIPVSESANRVSFTFLRSDRIALTDDTDLANLVAAKKHEADSGDWPQRFERLAGSPIFAVIRQDAAPGAALAERTPDGIRSPQLSSLLDQLQWITLAAKPEGDRLHVVAEGECIAEATSHQLADVLHGIVLLASEGLNDAKTRQQLDPALRAAYLDLLKSADVSKIDRGDIKFVRLAFEITPAFLDAASRARSALPGGASPKPAPGNASRSKKGHT